MIVTNKIEPKWTYYNEIEKLKKSLSNLEIKLNQNIKGQERVFLNSISSIKSDVKKISDESILTSKGICSSLLSEVKNIEQNISLKIDSLDKEHNQKNIQIYNTLNSYKKQVDTLHFDIIDNEDNLAINYINPNGVLESGYIKKVVPDNKTLSLDKDNKLALNYKFNPQTFDINSKNNEINVTGLSLNNGKYLDADRINNDLNNANYNISSLNYKIENILKKLNNINGYLASNNFKNSNPDQNSLTNFAIECISKTNNKITIDLIPTGTKIKNTFDNHIWAFNKITHNDGLTSYKWEDFGSDNVCIASNDGIHGLVAGSQEHFKVFVDINGVMSINGLEEDFQSLLQSVSEIAIQMNSYESKILDLESRLKKIEENA